MDPIKDAFEKVKEDINNLYYEMRYLGTQLHELTQQISKQNQEINNVKRTLETKTHPTENQDTPSFPLDTSTDTSTHNIALEAVKSPNPYISNGNKGVSTDRQTDKQTDNTLNQVSEVLESLNKIKEEVRIKFKRLTNQEIAIFSLIYTLEEKGFAVDYQLLAQHLDITESSVRDHVQRLIKKGIPIEKAKENNKKIILSISKNLKELAPLESLLKLRDL